MTGSKMRYNLQIFGVANAMSIYVYGIYKSQNYYKHIYLDDSGNKFEFPWKILDYIQFDVTLNELQQQIYNIQ